MKQLLTVKDTFLISGRGLVVVPGPLVGSVPGPIDIQVELRLPGGTKRISTLNLAYEFLCPGPHIQRWSCVFKSLGKGDVPIGTEVWCEEEFLIIPQRNTAEIV